MLELGRRQRGRGCSQLTVAQRLAARHVDDLVVLRPAVRIGHAPGQRRRMLQHLPCCSAACAHGLDEVADAARSVRVLVAVLLLVAGRLDDLDARPIGFHFVRDHHGQAGARARSHFGAMGHDRDSPVRGDGDEHVRIIDRPARHAVRAGLVCVDRAAVRQCRARQELRCDDQPAGCNDALEQVAAADVFDDGLMGEFDGFSSQASFAAAVLIAAKIR